MCACENAMLTSDVKVSTTSSRKTYVSWATAPKRPDQRIMFRTLKDFTLSEITKEVCILWCHLHIKDIFRAQILNAKLRNYGTSLSSSLPQSSHPQISILVPKTDVKFCLLEVLCWWILFPSSPSRFRSRAACRHLPRNQNERRRTSGQWQILVLLDCTREDCSGDMKTEGKFIFQQFISLSR